MKQRRRRQQELVDRSGDGQGLADAHYRADEEHKETGGCPRTPRHIQRDVARDKVANIGAPMSERCSNACLVGRAVAVEG